MEADMRAVDDVIRARLGSDVLLIRQVAEYIVGGGGKIGRASCRERVLTGV